MSAYFAVDLATGDQMVKSLRQMQEDVTRMIARLGAVERIVNLGDLEEARSIAAFNQMVASEGDESARAVLEKFNEALNNAVAAVEQGMTNYREVEAATEARQRELGGPELSGTIRPAGG